MKCLGWLPGSTLAASRFARGRERFEVMERAKDLSISNLTDLSVKFGQSFLYFFVSFFFKCSFCTDLPSER